MDIHKYRFSPDKSGLVKASNIYKKKSQRKNSETFKFFGNPRKKIKQGRDSNSNLKKVQFNEYDGLVPINRDWFKPEIFIKKVSKKKL